MKMLTMACSAMLALVGLVEAAQMPPAPTPIPEGAIITGSAPAALYCNVRYKDLKNIHPCAVEKIVAVPNPCPDPCATCGSQDCVFIKICVPPCDCYETKCKKSGRKITYDFGSYEVEITSSRGVITVDYDD